MLSVGDFSYVGSSLAVGTICVRYLQKKQGEYLGTARKTTSSVTERSKASRFLRDLEAVYWSNDSIKIVPLKGPCNHLRTEY